MAGHPSWVVSHSRVVTHHRTKRKAYRAMHTHIARQSIPLLATVLPLTKLYIEEGETFRCSQIQTFDVTWGGVHVPLAAWCMPYLHTGVSPFKGCATTRILNCLSPHRVRKVVHLTPMLLSDLSQANLCGMGTMYTHEVPVVCV